MLVVPVVHLLLSLITTVLFCVAAVTAASRAPRHLLWTALMAASGVCSAASGGVNLIFMSLVQQGGLRTERHPCRAGRPGHTQKSSAFGVRNHSCGCLAERAQCCRGSLTALAGPAAVTFPYCRTDMAPKRSGLDVAPHTRLPVVTGTTCGSDRAASRVHRIASCSSTPTDTRLFL